MTEAKDKLLTETVKRAVDIGFGIEPAEQLEDIFAEKIMVIGTAAEEMYTSLDGLRELIRMQKEQSQGMELDFSITEIYRDLPGDGNIAVIVQEIQLSIKINNESISFNMRASAVAEWKNEQWKIIHWHVSKPDQVQSEVDTYGIEQWKQKTEALEKLVAERTADLVSKHDELKTAMADLQSAQAQLIQSEKMASLGELTAGIAHEIQNPLNFVNNFSEVSNELVDEMTIELDKGDIQEAKVIAGDLKQNLQKIHFHGNRADAIVKGMLQHSRSSKGQKEPTDINRLADEYLRLSYHGLRAKDKSFNAALKTDFDESIGYINIVPQDIGRVLMNLLTNAFYAVHQKQQELEAGLTVAEQLSKGYEPMVSVSTKKIGDKIEIKVTDSGKGIQPNIIDKIFQPFFTTKPTGQGTGLGLSLSYDIITKGHGGALTVETNEENGTTFIIQIPNS